MLHSDVQPGDFSCSACRTQTRPGSSRALFCFGDCLPRHGDGQEPGCRLGPGRAAQSMEACSPGKRSAPGAFARSSSSQSVARVSAAHPGLLARSSSSQPVARVSAAHPGLLARRSSSQSVAWISAAHPGLLARSSSSQSVARVSVAHPGHFARSSSGQVGSPCKRSAPGASRETLLPANHSLDRNNANRELSAKSAGCAALTRATASTGPANPVPMLNAGYWRCLLVARPVQKGA